MDAELFWTATGTIVACAGFFFSLRPRPETRHAQDSASDDGIPGSSVSPPVGTLPAEIHGRDKLLKDLQKKVRRSPDSFVVLVGMGGAGKSTVAAALADRLRRRRLGRRPHVWWISAVDVSTLTTGLITVARSLGASPADRTVISLGRSDGPDRLWALLERSRRRWVLIFDNADDADVMSVSDRNAPSEGGARAETGSGRAWLRPSRRGLVIVTSRNSDRRTWGRDARLIPVGPLDETSAARVLSDLAPGAGSPHAARELARRLGHLPLALQLAGRYLGSSFARWRDFSAYLEALNRNEALDTMGFPDLRANTRTLIMRTWELSLDDLASAGTPQARPLLRLLSCFAPVAPVPWEILDPVMLTELLDETGRAEGAPHSDPGHRLERGLWDLERLNLITISDSPESDRVISLHPMITDINRAHLSGRNAPESAEPDPELVRRSAIDLLIHSLGHLNPEVASSWPLFARLVPHLQAVLEVTAGQAGISRRADLAELVPRVAGALTLSGATSPGRLLCETALDALRDLGDEHPAILSIRHEYAMIAAHQGRWVESEQIYRDVLESRIRVLGHEHPDTLTTSHFLAWEVAVLRGLDVAERMYRDVLQIRQRVLGDEHPDTLATWHELAWVTAGRGEWEEAEGIYREVLSVRRRVLGPDDPNTLMSSHELGWVIANRERYDEAQVVLEQTLRDRERVFHDKHPRVLSTRHELAWVTARQGRWRKAEHLYLNILRRQQEVLGEDHPDTLTTEHELAWVWAARGRTAEAERGYKRVLLARGRLLGEDHPDTRTTSEALTALGEGRIVPARHLA
ncbi:FxSxx-COOH system tetratricopeptide repeat protein [Streptosporangium sp. NPDC051022]|uniref:FxSxx-COOH system tetratricopeptide repeat protein n=1 Tax=Streptosporangium sp. NPDC051022 TaxID=3155752 RepID=UPI003434C110